MDSPPADFCALLRRLTESARDERALSEAQMTTAMRAMLDGEWTAAQTAGFLIALKAKGETIGELTAAVRVMRQRATAVDLPPAMRAMAVDTCGTGGDGAHTFNISTTAAFVAAAAGAIIAKHGNRAVSSRSGSSDVLALLGMPLTLSPQKTAAVLAKTGVTFMFAPNHHPATKNVAPIRGELGVRTMFNLLGPLSNPAGVSRQVTGVFSAELLIPYAEVLAACGAVRAMVVHGDGLDEITIGGQTDIAELKDGAIIRRTVAPSAAGLQTATVEELRVSSVEESKQIMLAVLAKKSGAARDIVLLNAAAILIVAEIADDFADGVQKAAAAIDNGNAQKKLDEFIAATKE